MDMQILEKIGMTKGEIKVYFSLLKLGECTVTPLVRNSNVSKSKVYDILEKLIGRGLVGYAIKDKKRFFHASDPVKIFDYLEKKEAEFIKEKKEVEKIMPFLRSKTSETIENQKAVIYEGINGYETVRNELLSELPSGENLLVIGAPALANIKYDERLLEFHRKREKRRIGMKIVYNLDAKRFAEKRKKLKLTQVKFMYENTITPSWIEIFKKSVLIGVISEDYLFCFVIKDLKVAESFRHYFNIIWKIAKK